jgi:acetolactate synthase-1/2/3 large subunit
MISKNMSTAYIFSGGSIMSLINHLHPKNNINKMQYFVPTSEASAGFCSIGHNKSLNRCDSIVITTSGPGLTNVLTPLADAYYDGVPLLVISGDVATDAKGKHSFQECDSIALTKSITYWNYSLTNENETRSVFNNAFELLKQNKQVHINIPKDTLSKIILKDENIELKLDNNLQKSNYTIESIKNIANIINNTYKPIICVGRGGNNASDEVRELAIKANIPITTTLHGLGIFDEDHYLSLKWHGMHGSEIANHAIQMATCIICIGGRFDDRTIGNVSKYAPYARHIIHINNNLSEFNKVIPNTINIHGDSKTILTDLLPYIIHNKNTKYIENLHELFNIHFPYNISGLKQQHILTILNTELLKRTEIKKKTIITTGVGNHQMYTAQLITHKYPNKFITSGSLGTMGFGCSSAIGAKIANPNSYVFLIDGDGSFSMLNDLKMIMNYKIADDYVLATGKKHTVKEFLEMALSYLNISYYWKGDECFDKKNNILISTIDKKYFRPAEVDLLIGDPTKAKTILGWAPKYNLEKIIIDMMDADLKRYYNKN